MISITFPQIGTWVGTVNCDRLLWKRQWIFGWKAANLTTFLETVRFSGVSLLLGVSFCFLDYPDWGFSVLFLICKANARVKLAKSGHGPHLFRIIVFCVVLVIVLCYCLYAVLLLCCTVSVLLCYYLCCPMYWLCVLYHCRRVLTQLQLTNISIMESAPLVNGQTLCAL